MRDKIRFGFCYFKACSEFRTFYNMELYKKLKIIRKHLGLTQDQMAERLGLKSVSRRARISEWESGKGEPKRNILIKYSEVVDIDIRLLLDDKLEFNLLQ